MFARLTLRMPFLPEISKTLQAPTSEQREHGCLRLVKGRLYRRPSSHRTAKICSEISHCSLDNRYYSLLEWSEKEKKVCWIFLLRFVSKQTSVIKCVLHTCNFHIVIAYRLKYWHEIDLNNIRCRAFWNDRKKCHLTLTFAFIHEQ